MNVLSLSYGKDSLACLGACEVLGIPIDRIVHAEVWATDTIPADLPPMVDFKKHADKIIKERYGIEVEHICALKTQGWAVANKLMNQCFITFSKKGKHVGAIKGFPQTIGSWCKKLKFETNGVDVKKICLVNRRQQKQLCTNPRNCRRRAETH